MKHTYVYQSKSRYPEKLPSTSDFFFGTGIQKPKRTSNIKQEYSKFLSSYGFTHFVTLTYDDRKRTNQPSISSARMHVQSLYKELNHAYAESGFRGCLDAFFSFESGHRTGRVHAHGLLRFDKLSKESAERSIYGWWYPKFGACKTEAIRTKGAGWYVAKYILKDQNEDTYEFFK